MSLRFVFSRLLERCVHISAIRKCTFESTSRVMHGCSLTGVTMGRYSYVGGYTKINYCDIGNFCSIAGHCSIGSGTHCMEYVSTSPVFTSGKNILKKNFSAHELEAYHKTYIGHDVWIGEGVYIKAGVKIANGAVVGMGSVVTHDVGPYEVWAGVPARMIRHRFDNEICQALEESQWWHADEKTLEQYAKYFNHPDTFVKMMRKGEL